MSLWLESLFNALYDCGDNPLGKSKRILAYLSMPVPRTWWEHALESGRVEDAHVSILNDLRAELLKVRKLRNQISSSILVALAFIEDNESNNGKNYSNDIKIDDYISKAKEVLVKQPELNRLGGLIDEKIATTRLK